MLKHSQAGITLLEVLVVIMLTGMISTLLMQAIGFSLASFQRTRDFQQRYQREMLAFGWLRSSVENMMAAHDAEFAFEGDSSVIQGFSLAPVFSVSGSLVKVKWTIRGEGESQSLWYQENDGLTMLVADWATGKVRFKYRGVDGQWQDQWPDEQVRPGILPLQVMLEVKDESVAELRDILMATKIRRLPVVDIRDTL